LVKECSLGFNLLLVCVLFFIVFKRLAPFGRVVEQHIFSF